MKRRIVLLILLSVLCVSVTESNEGLDEIAYQSDCLGQGGLGERLKCLEGENVTLWQKVAELEKKLQNLTSNKTIGDLTSRVKTLEEDKFTEADFDGKITNVSQNITNLQTTTNSKISNIETQIQSINEAIEEKTLILVTRNSDWEIVEKDFDGTAMVKVPAGISIMGSENGDSDEKPIHTHIIPKEFWIDKTEVTRAAYQKCVDAGECNPKPSNEYSSEPNQPVNYITWYQAAKYCKWRGARLPTEVEWEYAARGPDGLKYPWKGNDVDQNRARYDENLSNKTATVGNYPNGKSWVGALDMSGNVWEWTSSLYLPYPYINDYLRNLTGNEDNISEKIALRGGSFGGDSDYLRAANRGRNSAGVDHSDFGFRCVRS